MKVVLVNQFYPPASAPTGRLLQVLASGLAKRGHHVSVVTSAFAYQGVQSVVPDVAHEENVKIFRLGRAGVHARGLIGKAGDYLSFYVRARRILKMMAPSTDAFLFMTTPPLIGLIGKSISKYTGKRYGLWIMDLYPHALAASGLIKASGFLGKMINRFFKAERRAAAAIISLGPDMTDLIKAEGVPIVHEVPVWSDLQTSPDVVQQSANLRKARGWADHELVLMYSGNMGRAHDMQSFAALAKLLRSTGTKAKVVACGEGPRKKEWQAIHGTVVDFLPAQAVDVAAHLLSADVHLVSQLPAWKGVVVPSKFQAACQLGRPVIYSGPADSAVGRWVSAYTAGWIMDPADPLAVSKIAREIVDPEERRKRGENAARLARQLFDREKNVASIISILERMAGVAA